MVLRISANFPSMSFTNCFLPVTHSSPVLSSLCSSEHLSFSIFPSLTCLPCLSKWLALPHSTRLSYQTYLPYPHPASSLFLFPNASSYRHYAQLWLCSSELTPCSSCCYRMVASDSDPISTSPDLTTERKRQMQLNFSRNQVSPAGSDARTRTSDMSRADTGRADTNRDRTDTDRERWTRALNGLTR